MAKRYVRIGNNVGMCSYTGIGLLEGNITKHESVTDGRMDGCTQRMN